MIRLHLGDSVEVMRTMADASVDSVIVDPPYGLSEHSHKAVIECLTAWLAGEEYKPNKKGFMGRSWDAWVPGPEVFREALRVIKPGGHMLCFAGTRSMDLMMMAIRLAGWELRDSIGYAHDPGDQFQPALLAWAYGSGFPKSRDVSKDIDKMAGVERPDAVKGGHIGMSIGGGDARNEAAAALHGINHVNKGAAMRGTPVSDSAKQWEGWGTALKPAWEPIILARKPLQGTIAENVLAHGTGAFNIDGCRIETDDDLNGGAYVEKGCRTVSNSLHAGTGMNQPGKTTGREFVQPEGRWPANLIHDGSEQVLAFFPEASGARGDVTGEEASAVAANTLNTRARVPYKRTGEASASRRYHESGKTGLSILPGDRREPADSAARFFYCAKASAADRHEGLEHPGKQFANGATLRDAENLGKERKGNHHPTVKPTDLMRYLVKLITPKGGRVLDFCMGSGSTGKACEIEGFDFEGIDNDPECVRIARARIGASAPLFQEAA